MKKLFLVRHAKSNWDFPGLSDIERPLNLRGKKDAPIMGRFLKTKEVKPDLLISSPASRALSTALLFAQEIGYDKNIQVNQKIYHAYANDLWSLLKNISDEIDSLMIFGHNPTFTEFANELTRETIDNLPTSSIFAVAWQVKTWSEIKPNKGELLFFEFPKKTSEK